MRTERLYYSDCYLRKFDATVMEAADGGRRIYLDRTAFYPTSGGQLFDLGTLGGIPIAEVVDEEDRVAHVMTAPVLAEAVGGEIDWDRRYDLMQQHTGQHLLSAVLEELFGLKTVSVHMGLESSTVDVSAAVVTEQQLERAEQRCAAIIAEARPVEISFEDSSGDLGLRKESARSGTLRIVSIHGVDRSACGGTHLRSSAEIGLVLTGKLDKIRGATRIEFVCGNRALRRARNDNQTLAGITRALSMPAEQAAGRIAALTEQTKSIEKERLRLATELARREGRELYTATDQDSSGVRRVRQDAVIDDAMRVRAQAFVANPNAVFLAVSAAPPSVLLACSTDSGMNAGDRLKAALAKVAGRGGGNQALAQGSVPDVDALERLVEDLFQ
ncbi:MAG: DHHA1 domain-containing protein [Acidobacteriota bacterium]